MGRRRIACAAFLCDDFACLYRNVAVGLAVILGAALAYPRRKTTRRKMSVKRVFMLVVLDDDDIPTPPCACAVGVGAVAVVGVDNGSVFGGCNGTPADVEINPSCAMIGKTAGHGCPASIFPRELIVQQRGGWGERWIVLHPEGRVVYSDWR